MKYQKGTFSWVQGGWLTAGMILLGSIELLSGVAALLKPVEEFVGMNVVIFAILLSWWVS